MKGFSMRDLRSLRERMSAIGYTITDQRNKVHFRMVLDRKGNELGFFSLRRVIDFLEENEKKLNFSQPIK